MNELFGDVGTVGVSGVDEIDAEFDAATQNAQGPVAVAGGTPHARTGELHRPETESPHVQDAQLHRFLDRHQHSSLDSIAGSGRLRQKATHQYVIVPLDFALIYADPALSAPRNLALLIVRRRDRQNQ